MNTFELIGACLLLAVAGLAAPSCIAAAYYVDMSEGSDTNNGTSTNSAWQHCPGDTNATSVPKVANLKPGDTLFFKGGVSYTNTINCNWSGTGAAPITYDGNSAGTWGPSNAVVDEQYLNTDCFIVSAEANLVFKSFIVEHAGGVPPSTYGNYSYPATNGRPLLPDIVGHGMYLVQVTNVTIQDTLFKEMAYWSNTLPVNTPSSGLDGYGVRIYSCLNVIITNCEFTRVWIGIHVTSGWPAATLVTSNLVITGCNIHNSIVWGIAIGPSADSAVLEDICITNNAIHDYPELTASYWQGGGEFPHCDGIIMGITTAFTNVVTTNVNIVGNTFYWNSTNGGGTAYIFLTTIGGTVNVYNNVCLNNYNSYGFLYIQDAAFPSNYLTPTVVNMFNNTIVNPNAGFYMRWTSPAGGGDPGLATVDVLNNIFYLLNTNTFTVPLNIQGTSNGPQMLNYNLYCPIETYNQTYTAAWTTNTATYVAQLGQMQANWRYESNGLVGNPMFANLSYGLGSNSSSNDVHLQSASPAVLHGTNLSAFFSLDKDGKPRPATGAWDIGAYEFSRPLQALTNLHVISQ